MTATRSSAAPDAASVCSDPEWLPAALDLANGQLSFLHVPRAVHAKVSFLSRDYLAEVAPRSVTLKCAAVQQALPEPSEGPHFIFHSAFCCSTLLARALQQPGVAMGLKEPEILTQLAALARESRALPGQIHLVVRLLGRPFEAGEKVVVKPTNVANILIDELMRAAPRSHALLLHAPLREWLRSVAAKGLWGRTWARRLYAVLARDFGSPFGYSGAELFEQTDLQVGALAWLLHQRQFAELAHRMPDRVRTLDSASFLADRAKTLAALARLFGLALDTKAIEAIVSGPAFAEDAKKIGRDFHSRDAGQAEGGTEEEIDMVCQWAAAVAAHAGIPLELPRETRLLVEAIP